jgi:hypothetical protein
MGISIWLSISLLFVSISLIIQAIWLRDLSKRMGKIENIIFIRGWLESVERGESYSDLAYMKEKGFLK